MDDNIPIKARAALAAFAQIADLSVPDANQRVLAVLNELGPLHTVLDAHRKLEQLFTDLEKEQNAQEPTNTSHGAWPPER